MSFKGYQGRERAFWESHHRRYRGSILAVGRGNTTPAVNEQEYRRAREQFVSMVKEDLGSKLSERSVLDCGYGHGHYARACKALGIPRYHGVDFASATRPQLGPGYVFETRDLGVPMDLGRKFDLVVCLDVIFHIVDDSKFAVALDNIRRHASGFIYVTGLFQDKLIEPYVKHRRLDAFSGLGKHLSTHPWRDNKIARFEVQP